MPRDGSNREIGAVALGGGCADGHVDQSPAPQQPSVVDLEQKIEQLTEALRTRERIGFVCGVLAARFDLTPDAAWNLLSRLSQTMNVKVRELARVIHDDFCGSLQREDLSLAARLNKQFGGTRPLLTDRRIS